MDGLLHASSLYPVFYSDTERIFMGGAGGKALGLAPSVTARSAIDRASWGVLASTAPVASSRKVFMMLSLWFTI